MLHALAFNTLLSSQETDAYTITLTRPTGPAELRGVPFRTTILPGMSVSCQTVGFPTLDSIPPNPLGLRPPCFQGNPSNLLQHPVAVQSCGHIQLAGIYERRVQDTALHEEL